jgi:hypothetical protein
MVETKESPLSKLMVSMPQVTVAIQEQEPVGKLDAHILHAANLLVGNYNITEHNAYLGLWHR